MLHNNERANVSDKRIDDCGKTASSRETDGDVWFSFRTRTGTTTKIRRVEQKQKWQKVRSASLNEEYSIIQYFGNSFF